MPGNETLYRQLREEATVAGALNILMYLSQYFAVGNGEATVLELLARIRAHPELEQSEWDLRKLEILEQAAGRHSELGRMILGDQSHFTQGNPDVLLSCTFSAQDRPSLYVVYRGTGAAEWLDNGIAMGGRVDCSAGQLQAAAYFDRIVKLHRWDLLQPDIRVTGHSKGGNKTQFVMMAAAHADRIHAGYSFDGQAMSPQTMAWMRRSVGEAAYERRRRRLYGISADNDYVTPLGSGGGETLIPPEHVVYLESRLKGIRYHYPDNYFTQDGELTGPAEQGKLARYVEQVSGVISGLPVSLRSVLTEGLMGIIQSAKAVPPADGEQVSWEKMLASVPLAFHSLGAGALRYLWETWHIDLEWLGEALRGLTAGIFHLFHLAQGRRSSAAEGVIRRCITQLQAKAEGVGREVTQKVIAVLQSFTPDGSAAVSRESVIQLNTYRLRRYAHRLEAVACRLSGVLAALPPDAKRERQAIREICSSLPAHVDCLESAAQMFEQAELDIVNAVAVRGG
ncbi:MAG: DUF2974 domain-containing protein [Clostridiales bacterium]|nr:DUF2974 domain-containing protein [Clostridiales bacterium]